MKHLATLISVLALTNGAKAGILAEEFVIDFTGNPQDPLLFFFKNNAADFDEANKLCKSFSGRLPNSLEELYGYTLNNQNFALKGKHFWTGMSKDDNSLYKWQDGRYIEYGKLGNIKSFWNATGNCARICCALTADPADINVVVFGKRILTPLEEVPCDMKKSTACLVESPESIFTNRIRPALRELDSLRFDMASANSLERDYLALKRSIQSLRTPLENLQAEIEALDRKPATSKPPSGTPPPPSFVKGGKGTFKETQELCKKLDGKMVQVKSEKENEQLSALVGDSAEFWISGERKNGKYVDLEGNEIKYTPWMEGKPDCGSGESCCLAISTWDTRGKGELFDAPCDEKFTQVCQVVPKEKTSHSEKVLELTLLASQAAKQDAILKQLVSMLTQLSSSFTG